MGLHTAAPQMGAPRIGAAKHLCERAHWSKAPERRIALRKGLIEVSVRVLVVEDDDDLARLLTIRLRNADFEVERAADGEAGVRLTREFDPEFVLMDWMMPVKSGIEAVEDIRADPTIHQPYIAMLSARTAPDDIFRARQAGIDEYIAKPVSALTVIDRVESIIETRRRLAEQLFAVPGALLVA